MNEKASSSGRVAIVTGAARGIGFAIAKEFTEAGMSVVLADIRGEAAEEAAKELSSAGGEAVATTTDITEVAQIDAMVATAVDRFGRLDVLVNNAAFHKPTYVLDVTEEEWDEAQAVCLRGNFFCAQRAARAMAVGDGGKIINISSMTTGLGHSKNVAYSSAKAGIEGMTKVMAVELAEYGIQVNAIAPGPVETEFVRQALTPEGRSMRLSHIPLGRLGEPVDIARAALYLSSPESEWVTGAVFAIDGGYTATGVNEQRPDLPIPS